MTAPQQPGREQEIRARVSAAEDGWHVVVDENDPHRFEIHGDGPTHVAVFGGNQDDGFASYLTRENAEFAANAREDVPWLLDENARLRAEHETWSKLGRSNLRNAQKEIDRLRAELSGYEVMNPQQCPAGKHTDWLVDSEYAHACPWCEIDRLRADRDAAVAAAVRHALEPVERLALTFQLSGNEFIAERIRAAAVATRAREQTHVVADDSDDPEHIDDCPGCEQGDDVICGDQFDDMACDRDPGHDGNHGYDTSEWVSAEAPARGEGQ